MRLQVLPEKLGGGGRNRIDWEIDDAVFKESAWVYSHFDSPHEVYLFFVKVAKISWWMLSTS